MSRHTGPRRPDRAGAGARDEIGVAALCLVTLRFADLIRAWASTIATADPERLWPVGPGNEDRKVLYRGSCDHPVPGVRGGRAPRRAAAETSRHAQGDRRAGSGRRHRRRVSPAERGASVTGTLQEPGAAGHVQRHALLCHRRGPAAVAPVLSGHQAVPQRDRQRSDPSVRPSVSWKASSRRRPRRNPERRNPERRKNDESATAAGIHRRPAVAVSCACRERILGLARGAQRSRSFQRRRRFTAGGLRGSQNRQPEVVLADAGEAGERAGRWLPEFRQAVMLNIGVFNSNNETPRFSAISKRRPPTIRGRYRFWSVTGLYVFRMRALEVGNRWGISILSATDST